MDKAPNLYLRVVVTLVAILAIFIHNEYPTKIDAVSAGFIVLAILPWLAPLIKSIEVAGFGKLELRVEKVASRQAALQGDVDSLQFLITGFVTHWELVHLQKLASGTAFPYKKEDRFINEIRRLRDFGLIEKLFAGPLQDIPAEGDLATLYKITERGRAYLELRKQTEKA